MVHVGGHVNNHRRSICFQRTTPNLSRKNDNKYCERAFCVGCERNFLPLFVVHRQTRYRCTMVAGSPNFGAESSLSPPAVPLVSMPMRCFLPSFLPRPSSHISRVNHRSSNLPFKWTQV